MPQRSKNVLKPLSILLVTLLIGVLLGAALTGNLVRNRLENFRAFTSGDGFVTQLTGIIEPTSDQQLEAITPILESSGHEIKEIVRLSRFQIYSVIQDMETELTPHLSEAQIQVLQERRRRVRERYRLIQN